MEDLKTILDSSMPIVEIKDAIKQFLQSAYDYLDKLRLTVVAMSLLQESSNLIGTVDPDVFISQVKNQISEIESTAKAVSKGYKTWITQNDKVINTINSSSDSEISKMQLKIQMLLSEYDDIIRLFGESRKKLSLPELLNK